MNAGLSQKATPEREAGTTPASRPPELPFAFILRAFAAFAVAVQPIRRLGRLAQPLRIS